MQHTFYCDPCGDERGWPRRIVPVKGRCQVCGGECNGNHIQTALLPTPPELPGQLRFNFKEKMNGRFWYDQTGTDDQ